MAFGITTEGFVAKRLADIKSELQDDFRTEFGSDTNLDDRGPWGQLIGIMSGRLETQWNLAEATYNSQFPETASGIGVDNALSLVGLARKNPTFSVVPLQFFGPDGTAIPQGTEVSQSINSTVVFQTSESGTINAGTGTNEVQEVNFSAVPDAGSWVIDFDGQQTGNLAFNISAALLQTELENLSNIGAGNVAVAGDFTAGFTITFQGSLAETPVPQITIPTNTLELTSSAVSATPSTTTEGVEPNVTISGIALTEGPVAAPATTLNTLDTPVSGVTSVTNPLDATLGEALETDADALARRDESLAAPGHSTIPAIRADILQLDGVVAAVVFENEDLVPDLAGRPGKSYEVVVQGGDEDEIAQAILDSKGGGAQTVGDILKTLKDVQGFDKFIRFSRPTDVLIYLNFNVTTNTQYPVDGDAQVAAALLAFGNGLNISDDVIVFTQLLCSINAIPGIIDVELEIGTTNPIPADGTQVVTFLNDGGDLRCEATAHVLQVGNRVKFSNTGGALPAGITADTLYFVVDTNANNFKVSDSRTGDPLSFFDGGSGTTQVEYGGFDENINISDTERAVFDSSRITVTSV